MSKALCELRDRVSVELVETTPALRQAYQLRYQVYCQERAFLPGRDGIETDDYDARSRHALLRWRATGEAIGTVRMVLPQAQEGVDDFPVERVCNRAFMHGFPRLRTGEVSRFALSKRHSAMVRELNPEAAALLRLSLLQGALWLSAKAGLTHWLAIMQPTLLRLLAGDGLYFKPLGAMVEYHGHRQPVVANLGAMLARVEREHPAIWAYLTRDGAWYTDQQCGPWAQLRALAA